jgi:hypothetical protein
MIDIQITIREKRTKPGRVGATLEADINAQQPTKEEISLAARVMEKLREVANEISTELDANVIMEERIFDPPPKD